MDWAKTTAKRDEKHLSFVIWCDFYKRFYGIIKSIKPDAVSSGIGILYKSRPHFSLETMRMLYNTFVFPYFTYCIEVWGNTYQSY